MNVQQALEILATRPYVRIKGSTNDGNGCVCALGAILRGDGWEDMSDEPDSWKKDGVIKSFVSPTEVAAATGLPANFLMSVMMYSDGNGMSGPQIAKALIYWSEK